MLKTWNVFDAAEILQWGEIWARKRLCISGENKNDFTSTTACIPKTKPQWGRGSTATPPSVPLLASGGLRLGGRDNRNLHGPQTTVWWSGSTAADHKHREYSGVVSTPLDAPCWATASPPTPPCHGPAYSVLIYSLTLGHFMIISYTLHLILILFIASVGSACLYFSIQLYLCFH